MSSHEEDLVGWIVGERKDGKYLYACNDCAEFGKNLGPHHKVLRLEAHLEGAYCVACLYELDEL